MVFLVIGIVKSVDIATTLCTNRRVPPTVGRYKRYVESNPDHWSYLCPEKAASSQQSNQIN